MTGAVLRTAGRCPRATPRGRLPRCAAHTSSAGRGSLLPAQCTAPGRRPRARHPVAVAAPAATQPPSAPPTRVPCDDAAGPRRCGPPAEPRCCEPAAPGRGAAMAAAVSVRRSPQRCTAARGHRFVCTGPAGARGVRLRGFERQVNPPPPRVTCRRVAAPLRGPGQSPVLPFACCVGSLRSVGRCGRCSCWCRFRFCGAPSRGCAGCGGMGRLRVSGPPTNRWPQAPLGLGGQGGVDGVPQPAESRPPRAGAEKSAIRLEAHETENEYFPAFCFLFAVHHCLGPVPGIDCFRKWLSFARYARPMPWRSGAVRGQPHAGPRSTPPPPPAPVTSESAGVRRHSTRSRTAALAAPGPMRRERPRVGYVSVRFRVEHADSDAGSLGTAWAEAGIVRGGGGGGWPCGGASAWVWVLMLAGPRPGAPTSRGVQRPKAAPGLPHAWPLHMGGRPCGALPRDLGRPGNRSSDPSGAVRLLRGLGEREMGGGGEGLS